MRIVFLDALLGIMFMYMETSVSAFESNSQTGMYNAKLLHVDKIPPLLPERNGRLPFSEVADMMKSLPAHPKRSRGHKEEKRRPSSAVPLPLSS